MYHKATVVRINKLHALQRYHIFKTIPDIKTYPGQPPILEYLSQRDYCTQVELADYLHVSPASIAVSIKRMQKAGLVKKCADETNLRCNKIYITQLGKEQNNILQYEFNKIDKQLFAGFTDKETKQLNDYLDRLIENLSGDVNTEDVIKFISRRVSENKEANKSND